MKYHYAVMYGEQGKPSDPTYYRFETASGRDFFVSEPGRTGVQPQPEDAYFREAIKTSLKLRNMLWKNTKSGHAVGVKK